MKPAYDYKKERTAVAEAVYAKVVERAGGEPPERHTLERQKFDRDYLEAVDKAWRLRKDQLMRPVETTVPCHRCGAKAHALVAPGDKPPLKLCAECTVLPYDYINDIPNKRNGEPMR